MKDRVEAIVRQPELPETPHGNDGQGRAVPDRHEPVSAPAARRTARGKAAVQIKARFSKREAEEVDRFTRTLSSYLRTTVKGSEITRALWTLAIRSGDGLADLAGRAPKLERPSYGDRLAMAEYEDEIAKFLLAALKNMR
ncbi:MAG: hypothetical protein ACFHWZ_17045 [Phycisphaerales bacterium]